MVNTGKNNKAPSRPLLPAQDLSQKGPEGEGAEFLPLWSQEVSTLPPHKGKTSRCHLAKNWGLRPQLTICTSQMSVQRGVLQPPGPRGAQTWGLRGFSVGRQVGTAAQES